MKSKIFLLSLGCPRNLVDSEVLMGILKARGFVITEDLNQAGIFIVNTCAFIEKAKQESIDAILELVSLKNERKGSRNKTQKKLIVTGCLPQRYANELKDGIPEIDGIFGSADFIKIPDFIKKLFIGKQRRITATPRFLYSHKDKRAFITPAHYAYAKIQEGCINNCSYCVIPKLRGPYRSRSLHSILEEIRHMRDSGVKEINLIGQDTTSYGVDRYGTMRIARLLRDASGIMKGKWVRLLYTHPAHFSDELIDVIGYERPICRYVDFPIQHINDRILKNMNRGVSRRGIIAMINKIRKRIPGCAIRTSVIVGFPGETEKQFKELLSFIKDIKFERLGAFTYSREEGTKAYNYPGQLPLEEKERRYNIILSTQQEISKEFNSKMLGKALEVIIDEKRGDNTYCGRTEMDAPEVDGMCYVKSKRHLKPGYLVNVRITDTTEYDLMGEEV